MTENANDTPRTIKVRTIRPNPSNPRLYFNEESLDQLKTSIQEVGVMVPLIVYLPSDNNDEYVLLDGERRWKSALELGLDTVPVNVIPEPSESENILRMFNIHSVRDEWPLVSIAISLRKIMDATGEEREGRLAEMTGLTRSTVRRAKRILNLPPSEIALIEEEAHLDRNDQIHREDLYLEIEAAASVLLNRVPEVAERYDRDFIIRQFARKREEETLRSVTDFRSVGKLVKAMDVVRRDRVVEAAIHLIENVGSNPVAVYEQIAAVPAERQALLHRSEQLITALEDLSETEALGDELVAVLRSFRDRIDQLLASR